MTSTLDPLLASRGIADAYRRYLVSTYSPRRRELGADFESLLLNDFRLTKGPILQASAPFEPGASVANLMAEGVLSAGWADLEQEFPLDRALHLHQEQAIRKAVTDRRNLIVSTGTGSGKTESFLVPIVDHLLREREAGTLAQPGIRALLLYPMNALANDQTKRLRRLIQRVDEITFGRYVGETKEDQVRAEEDFQARYPNEPRVPGELISRTAMREHPPHILLTNFAMLEYLLLRPEDTTFFDGPTSGHWRFLVLDEAHVYNGAQGTEVAMLLRRVRDRVLKSERGRLQCFATSATLGRGVQDHPELVRFGELLFDEPFSWDDGDRAQQDVVVATRRPLVQGASTFELPQEGFGPLQRAFRGGASTSELADSIADAPSPAPEEAPEAYLSRVLRTEEHVVALQAILERGSVDLRIAAGQLFTGPTAEADAVALVDLCVGARLREDDAPLLPARYHFFVRSLEGAFVCQHTAHRADRPRVRLSRHETCRTCELEGLSSKMFELGVCRHCRAEYLIGKLDDASILQLPGSASVTSNDFLLLGDPSDADDEDGAAIDTAGAAQGQATPAFLCPGCGFVGEKAHLGCGCAPGTPSIPVAIVRPSGTDPVLRRCAACAGRSGSEVVSRFLTGTDAPVAVVATELYQAIPPSTGAGATRIGEGRKLLTFSDSRQDAAFFAPYLERTYRRAVQRRLIAAAIDELSRTDPPHTEDIVERVRKLAVDAVVLDPDTSRHAQVGEVSAWLMEELMAFDRRQSIEGTGTAAISVKVPRGWEPPQPLRALGFEDGEIEDLMQLLLETVRTGGAMTMPDGVDIRDERFEPRNMDFGLRRSGPDRHVIAWLPGSGENRRLQILNKIFDRKGITADAADVLDGIWRHLADPTGPWAKTLVTSVDRQKGALLRLAWERFVFEPASEDHLPLRCDTCRRLWWRSVADICPGWKCPGAVVTVDDLAEVEAGHYASLYRTLKPIGVEVQEHTAQWTASEASRIQDQFVAGDVNVLSCSTTFELGVDVGEIQAVLLRNVPPSAANYVQRAGRAGRRTDSAALVVTYAQRRSHDLTFFDDPSRMVDGFVAPPMIDLVNPSIGRRHAHAVAYAAFERWWVDAGKEPHRSVADLFVNPDGPSGAEEFVTWLRSHPEAVQDALGRIVPSELEDQLGLGDWSWVDALTKPSDLEPTNGWLHRASGEVVEELEQLEQLIDEAFANQQGWRGDGLKKVRQALSNRQAIGFLGSRNVLPKYGFPVDVVELHLGGSGNALAAKLDLTRDLALAISDYAPGAKVVAAKSLWRSVGLAVRQGQTWPTYHWAICGNCGAYRQSLGDLPECAVCGATDAQQGKTGSYLLPLFGFVGRQDEKPGETRPLKMSLTETYFGSYRDVEPDLEPLELGTAVPIEFRTSRQGQIIVINRGPAGRGFRICEWCGHGEPAPAGAGARKGPKEHDNIAKPGRKCSGGLRHRHLGHHYLTDVVEIRFDARFDEEDARSLLYAVLGGVEAVDVARDDVDGTLHFHSHGGSPALVIFDTVAGGAGHSLRIAERLPEVLASARSRVATCECGEETSCYSCLRNYRNQFHHDKLRRGVALGLLDRVLNRSEDQQRFDDVLDAARPIVRAAVEAGCANPVVGWESADGTWIVELAWPAFKVAVVTGEDAERDRSLTVGGWRIFPAETAEADEVIAALR